jgi:hypothetical protein
LPTAATTAEAVQKTIKRRHALPTVAYSHVRAPYPQAGPQFPGASEKAESRCAQGFAGKLEIYLLDRGTRGV